MKQPTAPVQKDIREKALECFNDIEPQIYFAERLMQGFKDRYFGMSEEAFQSDETAKTDFVYDHEYIAAQIQAISDMLFNIRLKCEFVCGDKNDPIIAAHIRNEGEMRSWLNDENSEGRN